MVPLQVLNNPKVPEHAKAAAQQRLEQAISTTHTALEDWCISTSSSPTFKTLAPVIQAAVEALGPVPAWITNEAVDTNKEGSRMEEAALQLLKASMPSDCWQLIVNGHLVAVEGVLLKHLPQASAMKAEVDMLLLDASGVAVAVLEVKLAAANPLMTCVSDVGGFMQLVDTIKGKRIALKVKLPENDGEQMDVNEQLGSWNFLMRRPEGMVVPNGDVSSRGLAGSADDRGSALSLEQLIRSRSTSPPPNGNPASSSASTGATAAPVIEAPFGVPKWAEVEVQVAEDVVPIYMLGRGIGSAEWQRGLRAAGEVAALQILCRTPETMAAAAAAAVTTEAVSKAGMLASSTMDQQQQKLGKVALRLTEQQRVQVQQRVEKQLSQLRSCFILSMAAPAAHDL